MKLKAEDIVFFIVIGLMVFTALWLLSGSPTFIGALIALFVFAATSDIALWKKLHQIDKSTAVGFVKVKNELEKINDKLINIEDLIKKK